jgi:hypothetical protein
VDNRNYLGIYISKDTATVVCVNSQGAGETIVDSFHVSAHDQEQQKIQTLANLIARGIDERNLAFTDVAVALDCALFMQHSVHSEFSDPKQISATIRFDTEEALATDITDVALAFEVTSTNETGSTLTVFTAQRKILNEVLLSMQQNNLDPITMEPDVKCLSRFIDNKLTPDPSRQATLFAMLSRRSGYLIAPPVPGATSRKSAVVRTFLVGAKQNRTQILTREVLMTTALAQSEGKISHLRVFDSTGALDAHPLGEKLGLDVAGIDWFDSASGEVPADAIDDVDLAIARGAALSLAEKEHNVNFRNDFSPYQGKTIKTKNALKFASVSVTVLFIVVGLFFQTQLFLKNKNKKLLINRFAQDYAAVTRRQLDRSLPISQSVIRLGSEKRRLEDEKKGLITDETSISSKLTLVLSAFSQCAAKTDLNIKRLSITNQNISFSGDTANRQKTTVFINQLRESGLAVDRQNITTSGNRDTFNITVKPMK